MKAARHETADLCDELGLVELAKEIRGAVMLTVQRDAALKAFRAGGAIECAAKKFGAIAMYARASALVVAAFAALGDVDVRIAEQHEANSHPCDPALRRHARPGVFR